MVFSDSASTDSVFAAMLARVSEVNGSGSEAEPTTWPGAVDLAGRWVICDDTTGNGTGYWATCADGDGTAWRRLGPPDSDGSGRVRTWSTKQDAVAAVRAEFSRMPRAYHAVKLTAEQAALVVGDSILGDAAADALAHPCEPAVDTGVPAADDSTPPEPTSTADTAEAAKAEVVTVDAEIVDDESLPGPAEAANRYLAEAEAREITDRIIGHLESIWELLVAAYCGRAWLALEYPSWDEYCETEFGASRLRLPKEERRRVVHFLSEAGNMSIRPIASAMGISDNTVQRDLAAGVVNDYTSETNNA